VADYNHGPTSVLKNAFDSAFYEWQRNRLPSSAMASSGGAQARSEQLRGDGDRASDGGDQA